MSKAEIFVLLPREFKTRRRKNNGFECFLLFYFYCLIMNNIFFAYFVMWRLSDLMVI